MERMLEGVLATISFGIGGAIAWVIASTAYVAGVAVVGQCLKRRFEPGHEVSAMGAALLFIFMYWADWLKLD